MELRKAKKYFEKTVDESIQEALLAGHALPREHEKHLKKLIIMTSLEAYKKGWISCAKNTSQHILKQVGK